MDEVEAKNIGDDREEEQMRKLNWLIIRKQGASSDAGPIRLFGVDRLCSGSWKLGPACSSPS